MSHIRANGSAGNEAESPVLTIIRAVAAELETDPVELPPLYDSIDPQVLNDLFAGPSDGNQTESVQFNYNGYLVTVTSEGRVSLS